MGICERDGQPPFPEKDPGTHLGHSYRRSQDSRSGVGNFHRFEKSLKGSVFPASPVGCKKGDIGRKFGQRPCQRTVGLEVLHDEFRLFQRGGHRLGRHSRHSGLIRLSAPQDCNLPEPFF